MNDQIYEHNGMWLIKGDTHISEWAKEHGTIKCDPYLFKWLAPRLKDVSVVWDIGACIGDHTRFYLDEGKQVVAIEPNPVAFECLQRNCPEAMTYNMAASDKRGILNFSLSDNAGASRITENGDIPIPSMPLDEMEFPAPQFVKIDIEGWEFHALQGMEKTLEAYKPTLFIEINKGALEANGHSWRDIQDLLSEIGYKRFTIYPLESKKDDPQYDLFCE